MIVDFKFAVVGLQVTFTNLSTPPLAEGFKYRWNFGDGTIESHREVQVVHNYPNPGFFSVGLSVIQESTDTVVQQRVIEVPVYGEQVKTHLSGSIYDLINTYIPYNIFGSITYSIKQQFIEKWQLYIQPLVNHEVPIEEYNNELFYEALENQLIMELAAYDFMVLKASQTVSATASTVRDGNSQSETQVEGDGGQVKRIQTGPTEVEYFEGSGNDADLISSMVKALQPGGIIDLLKQNICMLAERLQIYLPICNRYPAERVVPKVVNRRVPGPLDGPDPSYPVKDSFNPWTHDPLQLH
jgi:PKD repeat protein|uniref:PKD domain n=1 Tax=Myoviridae sp. ct3Pt8 TaxID=2826608 RepID=A0A8S5MMD7_9CAUD|nr:MAG TPA: PKD domain [Myoviridae sp. ct3Pt8]